MKSILPPWEWWPVLSTWTSWITIVGVVIAVVTFCKPRFQMWVIRRAFHFSKRFAREMVIRGDLPLEGSMEKWKFNGQVWKLKIFGKLSPMELRLSFASLFAIVDEELKSNSIGDNYAPRPGTNPTIMEIAGYHHYRNKKEQEKESLRQHKGILCSGGCGTRYGKRHKKQGFLEEGVRNTGGSICNGVCTPESRIDHYCGMCKQERERQSILGT